MILTKILSKIFGTRNERELKRLQPIVRKINLLEEGMIKQGYVLKKNGKEIGTIKAIQSEGTSVSEAKRGERVAVSIDGPTVGRQIKEGDELTTVVSSNDIKILEELGMLDEVELAKKIQ